MEAPDWIDLPPGVLQLIFEKASTWQIPATSLAALVCRSWQRAAAGCRCTHLLYHSGPRAAKQSFAAWLKCNSPQLEAFMLTSSNSDLFLTALAEAAAAAQAAGSPLRLRTLRVLQCDFSVRTVGQLLAHLPHLRCLQLGSYERLHSWSSATDRHAVLEHLAPLQHATQLEELYLSMREYWWWEGSLAELLPPSLRRLSWDPPTVPQQHELAHLTQLTFLQLYRPGARSHLPAGLQQLELLGKWLDTEDMGVVEEQQRVVTAWAYPNLQQQHPQQLLSRFPKLRAAGVLAKQLSDTDARAVLQQQQQLSSLTVTMGRSAHPDITAGWMAVAATLRRLHLCYPHLQRPPARLGHRERDVLTQLTQLRVSLQEQGRPSKRQQPWQHDWAWVLGRMPSLRSLSVPVLLIPGPDCLWSLPQLRVLVLHCTWSWEGGAFGSSMPWLEECRRLPSQLQVLGVCGVPVGQEASWQLRRRLQQALGSNSGCEVVVGPDLDEVADPAQQLAGLPAALQQALA